MCIAGDGLLQNKCSLNTFVFALARFWLLYILCMLPVHFTFGHETNAIVILVISHSARV